MQHKQLARKLKCIINVLNTKENLLSIQDALCVHLHAIREGEMPQVP